jgi:hypothetical protein
MYSLLSQLRCHVDWLYNCLKATCTYPTPLSRSASTPACNNELVQESIVYNLTSILENRLSRTLKQRRLHNRNANVVLRQDLGLEAWW